MTLFADQSREQLRAAYREAWHKCLAGEPLQPLQAQIADVVREHPDYQALLSAGAPSEFGAENANPYLHMGLHLALREQVATDRPTGIASLYRRLAARLGGAHAAEHCMMDALAETLSEAQRSGLPPAEAVYLERLRRL